MAGKKAGRKQESSRPGIGHDAGAGRMRAAIPAVSGWEAPAAFSPLDCGICWMSGPVSLKQGMVSSTAGTAG